MFEWLKRLVGKKEPNKHTGRLPRPQNRKDYDPYYDPTSQMYLGGAAYQAVDHSPSYTPHSHDYGSSYDSGGSSDSGGGGGGSD